MITPYFLDVYSNQLKIAPPVKRDTALFPLFKATMVDITFAVDTNPYAKGKHTILEKFVSYADFCCSIFPFGDPPTGPFANEGPEHYATRCKKFTEPFENYHAVLAPFTAGLLTDFAAYEKMIKSGKLSGDDHAKWCDEFNEFVEKTSLPHLNHLYRLDRNLMQKMGMMP